MKSLYYEFYFFEPLFPLIGIKIKTNQEYFTWLLKSYAM